MERSDFLKLLGTAGLMACAGCALQSCSDSSSASVPAPPTNIDFTLDLTASGNASLLLDNGFVYKSGIIVVRLSAANYCAVSQACTHQGTTINYVVGSGSFQCPTHGSRFSTTGAVINGPAARSLKKYNTELTGTNLRVFS
jgi:cytochrome b6-f complex iron-sulfur subunit